ncbi:MAG: ABC transporter ATP-binding protein [Alphaproteobacteria bacterium]|jgi:ATP-binding cassette subfamily B protein|nr:ABC transporter ATP-binding protein [Alphaproteobacteria bacterium]
MSDGGPITAGERRALGWLFGFVRPQGRGLALVLGLSLATTAVITAQPYIMKLIIDDGILAGDMIMVGWLTGAMLLAGALNLGLGGLNRYAHVWLSGRVLFALRESVYRHLQRLSPTFFAGQRSGDILTRLDGDVAELQRFGIDAVLAAINGVLGLAAALGLMLWLSWKLALIALVAVPLEAGYLRLMRPRVQRRTRRLRERLSDVSAFLVETLPAIKFIQAAGREAREAARLESLNRLYLGDLLRLQITEFLTAAVPNLLTSVSRAAVFLAGGAMIIAGDMTLGGLIAFSTYLGFAMGPVQSLLGLYVGFMRMRVSLGRVMALTEAEPAVMAPAAPRTLPADAKGAIRIERVTFRYPDSATPVLDKVDLDLGPGAKLGVIGASGAGKTTLIDLLHRHYDPESGRILLDGVDLRDLDLCDLRRHIAVVAQDTVLFRGSIADNIRYAAPEADDAAMRAAASQAQIADFVQTLPQGYDTPIGERGARLSGGQRQRLGVARALLQEPLVLVLDEATSAVDRAAESRLTESIDRLFAGRTRIVITHRHEALAGVDRLVEIRDGRLTVPAVATTP